MFIFLIILHVIASVGLILIVLLQTGKGTGLANVFGSGGGVQSVFGAQTGDVLTRGTAVLAGMFLLTSVSLAALSMKKSSSVMKGRRHVDMPAGMPVVPSQSTQDLLNQIKQAAQGVKETVQKSIPAAVDEGRKTKDEGRETPVAPAAPVTEPVPSIPQTEQKPAEEAVAPSAQEPAAPVQQ